MKRLKSIYHRHERQQHWWAIIPFMNWPGISQIATSIIKMKNKTLPACWSLICATLRIQSAQICEKQPFFSFHFSFFTFLFSLYLCPSVKKICVCLWRKNDTTTKASKKQWSQKLYNKPFALFKTLLMWQCHIFVLVVFVPQPTRCCRKLRPPLKIEVFQK